MAMQSFVEEVGSAMAPLVAGLIAVRTSLHAAILLICIGAWLLCAAFFALTARRLPADILRLRSELDRRAAEARAAPARA
jgi:hypothetical protein